MKPPVIYHLSNRQRKELLVRGVELRIALPVPPHEIDDPLDWARSVLPQQLRALAVAAEEMELCVQAIRDTRPGALDSHLGAIVEPDGSTYVQTVVVIVVTLRPERHRHENDKIQWPIQVIFRGENLPPD